jgi:hypothetical protein
VNDLRAIGAWLAREARQLLATLRAPALWATFLVVLALWSLAYQFPAGHTLHVGGDHATRLREHDAPFLSGVHASEPEPPDTAWYDLPQPPYRWTEPQAEVLLPGLGGGAWIVRVLVAPGPRTEPVTSIWQLGDAAPVPVLLAPGERPRRYHLLGPASGGDLQLQLDTPPLDAPADPRALGLVLYQVAVAPAGSPPRAPHLATLALLAVALAGCFALLRRLVNAARGSHHEDTKTRSFFHIFQPSWLRVFVVTSVLLIAWMLVAHRTETALFAPALAALVWVCYLLAALLRPLVSALACARGLALGPHEYETPATITALAFGVRMGGMLHPYAIFSDTGLHLNNLVGLSSQVIGVASGALFFTEGLPCEAGAGQSPYPPGPYLTLLPGLLATGANHAAQRWMLQGSIALVESFGAALVWLLLRRFGRAPAVLGALLYAAAPPLLRSYMVGEMANLFAQALVLPLLVLLALWGQRGAVRRSVTMLSGLLAVLLLSHTGVSISAAALVGAWLGLYGTRRHEDTKTRRRTVVGVVIAGVIAATAALVLYYSAYGWLFEARRVLAEAQAALPAEQRCPPAKPLADKLQRWVVNLVLNERPALAGPLLLGGAAGALVLHWGGQVRRSLGILLAACWLGTLLSLGTLLGSDQAVRWQLFLFPALCLGAGLAFGLWRARGTAGRWVALASVAFLIWYAVADWVRQVGTYLH